MKKTSKKIVKKSNSVKKSSVKGSVKNLNKTSIDWTSIVNIPNFVTSLRIILSPFIMYAILNEHYATAFFLVLFAALTDSFDGKIARLLNKQTTFGALLDPVADVTLMVCTVIALLIQFQFPLWFGFIILFREAIIILGGVMCLFVGEVKLAKADVIGKLSRFFQLLSVIVYILAYVQNYNSILVTILLCFTALLTLVSTVIYLSRAIELLKSWKENR